MLKINEEQKKLIVFLSDERFRYHLFEVVSLFFRSEDIVFENKPEPPEEGLFFGINMKESGDEYQMGLDFYSGGSFIKGCAFSTEGNNDFEYNDLLNRARKILKAKVYTFLSELTGKIFPWGSLTGIRPAKIVNKMLDNGMDPCGILERLEEVYFISPKKAQLAFEVAETQDKIRKSMDPGSVSIYIGIPFCPTRCMYCSFTSNPIKKYAKLSDTYLDMLIHEMEVVSGKIRNSGKIIESIYIGGGTPTSLDARQLERLLGAVRRIWFNSSGEDIKEFCAEAGRPDSINRDKLAVLRDAGVTRISINPQTMNDQTLKIIGRCHDTKDFDRAYGDARDEGFSNINTDIIAGLPDETLDMFKYTLDKIADYRPENITVHTMSIKRAAELRFRSSQYNLSGDTETMVDLAYEAVKRLNMKPYYLYRQKNMLGNLENIGYSLPGYESLYNIHIMEEDQTIFAFGSGAISKIIKFEGENTCIRRIFNVKGVEEYIARIEEMIERKMVDEFL